MAEPRSGRHWSSSSGESEPQRLHALMSRRALTFASELQRFRNGSQRYLQRQRDGIVRATLVRSCALRPKRDRRTHNRAPLVSDGSAATQSRAHLRVGCGSQSTARALPFARRDYARRTALDARCRPPSRSIGRDGDIDGDRAGRAGSTCGLDSVRSAAACSGTRASGAKAARARVHRPDSTKRREDTVRAALAMVTLLEQLTEHFGGRCG